MQIEACVVTDLEEQTATLEWRELLSSRTVIIRRSEFEDFDPETDEDWEEEATIPKYGQVLASMVIPLSKFHEAVETRGGLTNFVERHLPRPLP